MWWTGAVSGRGHGRFWFGCGRVVIAHRFAFALAYGVEALDQVRVLGHRCDNPLCQRVGLGHVVASSAALNRREWAIRRLLAGNPLADPRGPRRRARELRDLALQNPSAGSRRFDPAPRADRGAVAAVVTLTGDGPAPSESTRRDT